MPTKTPKSPAKTPAAKRAVKPARKGTARTSNGGAAPVKTRTLKKLTKPGATAKLAKPTSRKAAPKPTKAATAKARATAKKSPDKVATANLSAVRKARAGGATWAETAEITGLSLSALARIRKNNGGRGSL